MYTVRSGNSLFFHLTGVHVDLVEQLQSEGELRRVDDRAEGDRVWSETHDVVAIFANIAHCDRQQHVVLVLHVLHARLLPAVTQDGYLLIILNTIMLNLMLYLVQTMFCAASSSRVSFLGISCDLITLPRLFLQ